MDQAKLTTPSIAIMGTGSDVGKSIIVTALCRYFVRQGLKVAPFKAQNMSNNSGVTAEGLEMGRAQIVQAEAAQIAPHVDMNPVLLKPTSEIGSQVVVLGRVSENTTAVDYHNKKETLFNIAFDSKHSVKSVNDNIEHDLLIMERVKPNHRKLGIDDIIKLNAFGPLIKTHQSKSAIDNTIYINPLILTSRGTSETKHTPENQ